jgi:hypothetical protein
MRRAKLVLAALSVTVSAFLAFAGPAMAVDCTHTNQAGVIECGKHDNRFLSEDRFFNNEFVPDNSLFGQPFLVSEFDDEIPVWCGDHWGEFDPEDGEVDC